MTKIGNWRRYDVDLAGAAMLAVVALAGYALAIHEPLTDSLNSDQAREQRDEMSVQVASLKAKCALTRRRIEEVTDRLAKTRTRLPDSHAVDDLICRLHDIASQCGVVLTRLQPVATARREAYQVGSFLIEGTATFSALHRWFALIESGVPYFDITNFSVRASRDKDQKGNAICVFECSQRFYFSDPDARPALSAGQP